MTDKLNIAVVVPTRGDRPQFLEQCKKLIAYQTREPDSIHIIDQTVVALSDKKDITARYRIGIQIARGFYADVIFFFEDDDWYAPEYIQTMLNGWEISGKPDLYGYASTTYYHLVIRKSVELKHPGRASMFNTLMRADTTVVLPPDDDPFTDIYLWKKLKGFADPVNPKTCIGIKHSTGLTGGIGHNKDWKGYNIEDPDGEKLKSLTRFDPFYKD